MPKACLVGVRALVATIRLWTNNGSCGGLQNRGFFVNPGFCHSLLSRFWMNHFYGEAVKCNNTQHKPFNSSWIRWFMWLQLALDLFSLLSRFLVFFLCRLKPTVLWICSFEIYEILLFGFGAVVRRFCHWAHPCQTLFCQTLRWPQRLFLAEEAPSLDKLTSQKIYAATVLLKHETIESYITTVVVAWYCQYDKLITYRVLWLRTVFWTYWITHNFPHALWNECVNPAQDLEQIPIVLDGRTHLSRLFQPNEPSTTSCSRLVGSKITWPLHVTFSLSK